MIDFGIGSEGFVAAHPDPATTLLGQSCDEAAKRLSFTDTVKDYLSCKHYEGDWFLDVTLMCHAKVSSLVVVWEPLPANIKNQPLPPDHCN